MRFAGFFPPTDEGAGPCSFEGPLGFLLGAAVQSSSDSHPQISLAVSWFSLLPSRFVITELALLFGCMVGFVDAA